MGDRIAASDWLQDGYPNGLPGTGPDTGPCGARVVGLQCGCNFDDQHNLVRPLPVIRERLLLSAQSIAHRRSNKLHFAKIGSVPKAVRNSNLFAVRSSV